MPAQPLHQLCAMTQGQLGGVLVRDGDIVIADDDGIVIWPREDIEGLVAKAGARRRSDAERLAKIRAG